MGCHLVLLISSLFTVLAYGTTETFYNPPPSHTHTYTQKNNAAYKAGFV